MKKHLVILLGMIFSIGTSQLVLASDEELTASINVPSNTEIHSTMENYITAVSKASGTLNVVDPETKKALNLSFVKIHKKVEKTGNNYYSCVDFKDANTGDSVDVDLDVADIDGKLSVVEMRIHKVEGKERYNYDDNNKRIALKDTDSYLGGIGMPRIRTNK